jgi:hypothetical protein
MLDLLSTAGEAGASNVGLSSPTPLIPLADASVDRAFLVTVLGEVPDQHAALAELHRVMGPVDSSGSRVSRRSDIVFLGKLRRMCREHRFEEVARYGNPGVRPSSRPHCGYAADVTRPGNRAAVTTANSAITNIIPKIVPTLVAVSQPAGSPADTGAQSRAITASTFDRLRAADEAPTFSPTPPTGS